MAEKFRDKQRDLWFGMDILQEMVRACTLMPISAALCAP